MLPLSTSQTVTYTPDYYEGKDKAPVYRIRVATLFDKAKFKAKLNQLGASPASDAEYYQALRDGYRALTGAAADGQMLELIDQKQAGGELEAHEVELYADLERALKAAYKPFADIFSRNVYYKDLLPIVAFQMFVSGWDGLDLQYEALNGEVTEQVMAKLPRYDLTIVGSKAFLMMMNSETDQKN